MSNIEISTYNNDYKDQIINLILDIQTKEFHVPVTIEDQPDLQIIPTFYQKQKGNFWVALAGKKVVGTIGLIDIGNEQCALRKMFVAKEYRGKEKGIATQLLNTAIDWCKEVGVNEIYLGTVAILHAAHRFYEKNGFQEIAKATLPPAFPLMQLDTKFYRYRITTPLV